MAGPAPNTPALSAADLNTTINHEPRILDTVLAGHLGMVRARNIRTVIEGASDELSAYGEVCTRAVQTSAKGGRPGKAYYLTEGQALCVCALSRAPKAPQARRALIEAFMELRRKRLEEQMPVAVKAHRRSKPVPALEQARPALPPPETVPGPFETGSDLLRDLHSAVYSALARVARKEASDFGQALRDVLDDRIGLAEGAKPSGVLMDWNWKRSPSMRGRTKA